MKCKNGVLWLLRMVIVQWKLTNRYNVINDMIFMVLMAPRL